MVIVLGVILILCADGQGVVASGGGAARSGAEEAGW